MRGRVRSPDDGHAIRSFSATRSAQRKAIGAQHDSEDAATISISTFGRKIMKTIRQLTLTVITALFVVTAALLWASASPKVTGQTTPTLAFDYPAAPTGAR
jgi:hypothetical protein